MNDFAKTKMAFVVALLAVLFTLSPLMSDVGKSGIHFLGVYLQIRYAYYLCSAFLALAAYFYGLELFKQSVWFAQRAGNFMYALAVLAPPAYLALLLIGLAGKWFRPLIKSDAIDNGIQLVCAILVGVLLFIAYRVLRAGLRDKDRSSSITQLRDEETTLVSKAGGLLEAGLYDLVLVEAIRAVETALRRLLISRNVPRSRGSIKELLEAAEAHKIISRETCDYVHDLRVLRNEVLHEGKAVTRATAQRGLQTTRKVVTSLDQAMNEANGKTTTSESPAE